MNMAQAEDQILLSSVLYTHQVAEGECRVRRRRRRSKAGSAGEEAKKRRLSAEQVKFLEMNFGRERKLESGRKVHLASELGLDPKQVAVWFQNRRARWKNKQLEEGFMKLKSSYDNVVLEKDNVVLEKFHLETEVLQLKERLSEAEKVIKRLSGSLDGETCSPSSCLSMNTQQPHLGEGLDLGVNENLLYIQGYNYINMVDWDDSLYGM